MTIEQLEKLRDEKPGDFNALAAKRVHGWAFSSANDHGQYFRKSGAFGVMKSGRLIKEIPDYARDPAADYETLKLVRVEWNSDAMERFSDAMCQTLHIRRHVDFSTQGTVSIFIRELATGSFTLAALAVATADDKEEA